MSESVALPLVAEGVAANIRHPASDHVHPAAGTVAEPFAKTLEQAEQRYPRLNPRAEAAPEEPPAVVDPALAVGGEELPPETMSGKHLPPLQVEMETGGETPSESVETTESLTPEDLELTAIAIAGAPTYQGEPPQRLDAPRAEEGTFAGRSPDGPDPAQPVGSEGEPVSARGGRFALRGEGDGLVEGAGHRGARDVGTPLPPAGTSGSEGDTGADPQNGRVSALSAPVPATEGASGPSSTGRAPPLVLEHPVGSQRWGEGLSNRVLWLVNQNGQQAELRLNPPELGPLEVRIALNNDQATLHFTVHNGVVRDAVEAALPRLREGLADAGLALNDVFVAERQGREQADTPFGSGAKASRPMSGAGGPDDEPPTDGLHEPLLAPRGLLDFYV